MSSELGGAPTLEGSGAGGALIGGRYQLLGLVGSGGMGSVYRARDRELDELVALKFVRTEWRDPQAVERFRQEVKLARRVTHRNVARTYDIGEHGAERFLTMEYVDGESLARLLAREGALPVERALMIGCELAEGLAAAHAAGVVHRDLKPENVLLEGGGRVVITDFGIARAMDAASRTQGVVGTPAYMAPEQVLGLPDIDARADLYALGAVLYEMLTGAPAWTGSSVFAIAAARLGSPPPDPRERIPTLPASVAALVLALLARERDERPSSSRATGDTLRALSTAPAHASAPASPPLPVPARDLFVAPAPPRDKTVAVLLFRASADDGVLAEELTEDLIDRLSMSGGLRVRAFGAVRSAQTGDRDPQAIGRALDVRVVVEGRLRRTAAGGVQVSARAIGVEDGFQIWAQRFEGSPGDLLAMNDRIAGAVAEALTVDARGTERKPLTDPRALELYVNARHALRRAWAGLSPLAPVVAAFDDALALAPDDPLILSGAATARARWLNFEPGADDARLQAARRLAERALRHAPTSGEPWLAMATLHHLQSDWPATVAALREAVLCAPGLAKAHELLATIQLEVGLVDEGLLRLEAVLGLDPDSTYARLEMARTLALLGLWDRAEALLEHPAPPGEDPSPRQLAFLRLQLWAGSERRIAVPEVTLLSAPARQYALAVTGDEAARRGALATAEAARPRSRLRPFLWQMATELAARDGEREQALAHVAKATENHLYDLLWLDRCPLLATIRDDERFAAARALVEERARAVRAAMEAPLPSRRR